VLKQRGLVLDVVTAQCIYRVSTTGNPGNLLEFNWSSW